MFHLRLDSDFRAANYQAPIILHAADEVSPNAIEIVFCTLAIVATIGLVWASPFLVTLVK